MHTYASAGSRNVTLTVTDAGGSNSRTRTVTTVAPPVANFTFNCTGLTCNFDASSSTAQATATYSWNWGDGTPNGTEKTATHTYASAGSRNVTLTVTDAGGSSTKTQTVTVTAPNQPPVANFTFNCWDLRCDFTSTSSDPDGSISAYSWNFGDNNTSSAQNPSHTYAAGGTYTVKLTVTDNRGAMASASKSVTVTQPNQTPTVNAGYDENVLLGLFYTLNASFNDPDNGPWSYTINWGDGSSTSGTKSYQGTISAGHDYVLIGSYTIRVTVTDSRGASGWDSKVLTVLAPLPGLP
jgi:PKD repeat protein